MKRQRLSSPLRTALAAVEVVRPLYFARFTSTAVDPNAIFQSECFLRRECFGCDSGIAHCEDAIVASHPFWRKRGVVRMNEDRRARETSLAKVAREIGPGKFCHEEVCGRPAGGDGDDRFGAGGKP